MNELKEKWINDIRSRMENHSEHLPVDLWEEIDAELSATKIIPMWRRWYSVAAAAAVIAIVSSVSVILWNRNFQGDVVRMAETLPYAESESIDSGIDDEPVLAEAADSETGTALESRIQIPVRPVYLSETAKDEESVSEDIAGTDMPGIAKAPSLKDSEEISEELSEEVLSDNEDAASKRRIDMMKADREVQKRNASYLAMEEGSRRKSGNDKFQVGLVAGNTPYNSYDNFGGISRLSSRKLVFQTNDIVISESSDGITYSQVLFNNRDKETYTNIKHHIPITVGANVKWHINNNWGVETGLTYTYLYSELQSGANSYIQDKQKLHYLGVPLKLHRSIWGNRTFSIYAAAGGTIEKCISGDIETICVDEKRGRSRESESVDVKPWQLSVAASLGAQVNFLKFMSLYVEPGMSYYFDDGSELLTIRKDKPFNFNLQFGLRFNVRK